AAMHRQNPRIFSWITVAAGIGDTPGIIPAGDLNAVRQIMLGGASYVNLHTVAHPAGELRGPIFFELDF
ncbi:CHRD domain-containing protein, partial [Candidatus Entotheonella palauensis]|uniref:CHRD domain-containing protein n=1 Tax=Candidatus Entotheonella palauensis TaxID=93172 RepID=UPI0011782C90